MMRRSSALQEQTVGHADGDLSSNDRWHSPAATGHGSARDRDSARFAPPPRRPLRIGGPPDSGSTEEKSTLCYKVASKAGLRRGRMEAAATLVRLSHTQNRSHIAAVCLFQRSEERRVGKEGRSRS